MFTVHATDDGNGNTMIACGDVPPGVSVGGQATDSTSNGGEVKAIARKIETWIQKIRQVRNPSPSIQRNSGSECRSQGE